MRHFLLVFLLLPLNCFSATVVGTITLDDGTILGTYTSVIPDAKIQAGISAYAVKKSYQATVFDDQGNVIPNPESAATFMIRTERQSVADVINQYIFEQADATAKASASKNQISF